MDVSMECGTCGTSEEICDVPNLEQVMTLRFAFAAAHEHPDWMFETTQRSKGGAYQGAGVYEGDDDDEGDA